MIDAILEFLRSTGVYKLLFDENGTFQTTWIQYLIMYVIVGVLFYLAIVKHFEPLLLMPIAFGMLLANIPGANLIHLEFFFDDYYVNLDGGLFANQLQAWFDAAGITAADFTYTDGAYAFNSPEIVAALENVFANGAETLEPTIRETLVNSLTFQDGLIHVKMTTVLKEVFNNGGLVDILYLGVKFGVYPSLIFLGVGAMTDFSPLISNPKSLLMGAGAQLGVFFAFFIAILTGVFTPQEAAAIGITGGADGPTAILVTKELAPQLLGAIAISAYSYMALIPIIQPPIMRALTTESERKIKMDANTRPVSTAEKILFPIIIAFVVCLIIPDATPLIAFLMLGNLFNVSGVSDRLSKTSQNELINIVTIFLGVSVGATANAENFLQFKTLLILALGLFAFALSTAGGVLTGKLMCKLTGGKINPLIGAAGVSAVPMAARVAQDEGRKADPSNFLLMHAMGPNVAGVIGSGIAAGVLIAIFS